MTRAWRATDLFHPRYILLLKKVRPFKTVWKRSTTNIEVRVNRWVREHGVSFLDWTFGRFSAIDIPDKPEMTLKARVHPFPAVGHQLSVWIAGYLWAGDLACRYEGPELPQDPGGLFRLPSSGQDSSRRSRRRNVFYVPMPPTPDERDPRSYRILRGYMVVVARMLRFADEIVFLSALDNPRWNQVPASSVIRDAVAKGAKGKRVAAYEAATLGRIVVHIRRGDISRNSVGRGSGVTRWKYEEWYVELIKKIRSLEAFQSASLDIVALGSPDDFPVLRQLPGVNLRLNGDKDEDFAMLASSDVLITAPSSFSFSAALASEGLVLAPTPWWHFVPNAGRWFTVSEDCQFDETRFASAVASIQKEFAGQ